MKNPVLPSHFRNAKSNPLMNEDGLLTIDFIFASIIVGGFFAIMFSLFLTLSVVEVTQYITYSTARVYFGGHWDPDQQTNLATRKFEELRGDETVAPLYSGGWFELTGDPGVQDWNSVYDSVLDPSQDSNNFIGSRVTLNAKILEFNIPLLGETSELDDAFRANVASYLNREPTSTECFEFMSSENRFNAFQQLDGSYRNSAVRNYVPIADNGC